tara:strand:+ start:1179 stop:1751 length:573 start_codon:yes stop_codon:yes gene_type:complete
MGLTTERKIFLGLMIVAGASLVVDQAILSPNSASADSLGAGDLNALPDQAMIASVTAPITKSVTQILNERLKNSELSGDVAINPEQLQQLFAPTHKPAPKQQVLSAPKSSVIQPVVEQMPVQSAPSDLPVLSAVMPSRSGQSGAILDGTLYRIGETTRNGYKLISVEKRQIVVSKEGKEYWVVLPAIIDE